jgi:RNA polymerase subunit RPABC4/transcription elongation factor Spt4
MSDAFNERLRLIRFRRKREHSKFTQELRVIPRWLIWTYLLVREPLPYPCPQCATSVSARFNFCPNCKTNLRPACTHCQREVSDNDKFCPYCGNDLAQPPSTQLATEASRP